MRDMDNLAFNLILYVVFLWSLFWKGIGLWRAANNNQKYWFVAMLILSTVGILEIIYLFRFAKARLTINELKSWFSGSYQVAKSKVTRTRVTDKKSK